MKVRPILHPFHLVLLLLLIPVFNENILAQKNLFADGNNFYAYSGDADKVSKLTRPRIFKGEENETSRTSVSKPVVAKAPVNMADLEQRVFELVNERRIEAGLSILIWNDNVASVARGHSENMANLKFFSHTGVDGKKVSDRADASGLRKWRSLGENIALNRGFKSPLESAVQSWMNSPGHRGNILKTDWQESGIGVAIADDGSYYFTQIFMKK